MLAAGQMSERQVEGDATGDGAALSSAKAVHFFIRSASQPVNISYTSLDDDASPLPKLVYLLQSS